MPNQLLLNSRVIGKIKSNKNWHGVIVAIEGNGRQRRFSVRWDHGQLSAPYTSNALLLEGDASATNNLEEGYEEAANNDVDIFFEGLSTASENDRRSISSDDEESRYKVEPFFSEII